MALPATTGLSASLVCLPSTEQPGALVADTTIKTNNPTMTANSTHPNSNSTQSPSSPQIKANSRSNSSTSNNSFVYQHNHNQQHQHQHQQHQQQHDSSSSMHGYAVKGQTNNQQHYQYSSLTSYYSCPCCGQRQPCKCSNVLNNVEASGKKMLSESEAFDFEHLRDMSPSRLIEQQYAHNHQSPPSSSSASSSSSTSSNNSRANIVANIDQCYDQEEYHSNNGHSNQHHHHQHLFHQHYHQQQQQQQQQHQGQHQFHQLHHNHNQNHHHNHNQHQHQHQHQHQDQQQHQHQHQQQQVSSQSDHQIVISGNSNNELLADNQLTYNYDEHEEVGAESWTMALDGPLQMAADSVFDDSTFRLSLNGSSTETLPGDQHVCQLNQQTYSQHVSSSSLHRIVPKETNDFNNNGRGQHNQQNLAFPSMAPMSNIGIVADQAAVQDPYGHQHRVSNPSHQFLGVNFYSSSCNDPIAYQQQQHQHLQQYCQDDYDDQHRNAHVQYSPSSDIISHNRKIIEPVRSISHQRQSPTSSSMHGGYDQVQQQSDQLQCHSLSDHNLNLSPIKPPLDNNQFHNHHNHRQAQAPQHQLYQSAAQIGQPREQQAPACKLPAEERQQTFEQGHNNDQYINKAGYTSLQQITSMNCDNYTNQVSTTTASADVQNQVANNKMRTFKGRRGRPRKKILRSKNKVNGKLWEFIRDLLLNDHTNPSFIRWERREDGVFKFVQSDKVAKMWGERKQNPKMTYEKLSRAMRYYYKSKVLLPVFGRRLVYKFGPNATGWLPDDGDIVY